MLFWPNIAGIGGQLIPAPAAAAIVPVSASQPIFGQVVQGVVNNPTPCELFWLHFRAAWNDARRGQFNTLQQLLDGQLWFHITFESNVETRQFPVPAGSNPCLALCALFSASPLRDVMMLDFSASQTRSAVDPLSFEYYGQCCVNLVYGTYGIQVVCTQVGQHHLVKGIRIVFR